MLKQCLILSILINILWHPLCLLSDYFIKDYDISTPLAMEGIHPLFKHTLRWDALQYLEIMRNGYEFVNNQAFGIGLPSLARIGYSLNHEFGLLLFFIIQKCLNVISTYLLYQITLLSFNMEKQKLHQFAYRACVFFILNPGLVFFNSLYTESPFMFLALLGIYLNLNQRPYLSAMVLSVSQFFRLNGLFFIIFSGFPILKQFIQKVLKQKFKSAGNDLIQGLIVALIYLIPYAINLYIPYALYCNLDEPPQWCKDTIPNCYTYIQVNFWDNGFMQSYTLDNYQFIYFSIQILIPICYWIQQVLLGKSKLIMNSNQIGLMIQQSILLGIYQFFALLHCTGRFLSTSLILYWALADIFRLSKLSVIFLITQFLLGGIVMHVNYLYWF